MRGDHGSHDRQAQARAAGLSRARAVATGEPFPDLVLQPGRDARPVVTDLKLHPAGPASQPDGNRCSARRVAARVAQQVRQDLVQPVLITADHDGLCWQVEHPPVVRARDPGVICHVDRQPGHIDRCAVERTACVEPSQQEQVIDQSAHSRRFGVDAAERAANLGPKVVAGAQGQLGVPADPGERCAQLVAGVRDELPQPGLRRLPLRERGLHVTEHLVQRLPQPANLGARVGCRYPLRQRDFAAPQGQRAHLGRGGGDAGERPEREPDQAHPS